VGYPRLRIFSPNHQSGWVPLRQGWETTKASPVLAFAFPSVIPLRESASPSTQPTPSQENRSDRIAVGQNGKSHPKGWLFIHPSAWRRASSGPAKPYPSHSTPNRIQPTHKEPNRAYNRFMSAEVQSASTQAVAVQFGTALAEQRRLRATLSPEELEADHMLKVEALLRSCKALSGEAERNGLTEEILAGILAEE